MNEDLAVIDPVLPLELEDLLSDVLLELVSNAATSEAEELTFDATSLRSVASGSTTVTPLPLPLPIIPEIPFPAENKLLPKLAVETLLPLPLLPSRQGGLEKRSLKKS